MYKKHYILIARSIKTARQAAPRYYRPTIDVMAEELADVFKSERNEFRKAQWLNACGCNDKDEPRNDCWDPGVSKSDLARDSKNPRDIYS